MPVTPNYPGVYVEELPSGVRTIVGVATSITAFIGRAKKGLLDRDVRVQSWADYQRQFGGLWEKSTMSYAVQQFFMNGGTDAIIVRIHNPGGESDQEQNSNLQAQTARLELPAGGNGALKLQAASPGGGCSRIATSRN